EKYIRRSNCIYYNSWRLPPPQVAKILQQSGVGLILSELEGISRASSEYLLTGLPVVSTASKGGRDVWYDDYNSIIVEPTEDAVWAAVQELKAHPRDPQRIRKAYLDRATVFRERFRTEVLAPIFKHYGVDADVEAVMQSHPFPWWKLPPALRL